MKKADMILIISILLLAAFLFLINKSHVSDDNMYVVISVDGEEVEKFLHRDMINKKIDINNEYGYNKILISEDGAKMLEADCKDRICVNTKEITKAGQSIVCLPHRLEVKLISDENEIDAVAK